MLIESSHYIVFVAGMQKDKGLVKWHLEFSEDKHFLIIVISSKAILIVINIMEENYRMLRKYTKKS